MVIIKSHEGGLAPHFLADVITEKRKFVLGGLDLNFLHRVSWVNSQSTSMVRAVHAKCEKPALPGVSSGLDR